MQKTEVGYRSHPNHDQKAGRIEQQMPCRQREVKRQEPGKNQRNKYQRRLERADKPRILTEKSSCESDYFHTT